MERNYEGTKRELFGKAIAMATTCGDENLVKFFEHEIELLNAKSANKKPTKAQIANESLKIQVLEILRSSAEGMTVAEIIATGALAEGTSNQKVTALVKLLKADGSVTVEEIKGKANKYRVADGE